MILAPLRIIHKYIILLEKKFKRKDLYLGEKIIRKKNKKDVVLSINYITSFLFVCVLIDLL